jgi:hypothetical protein
MPPPINPSIPVAAKHRKYQLWEKTVPEKTASQAIAKLSHL